MGATVVAGMESSAPSGLARAPGEGAPLNVRLLGPVTLSRAGRTLALPASRKVRALFAYLALAPQPVPRSQLCDLLWDVPNDPRGELRWCLSKIRGVVDEPGRSRVVTGGDAIGLDLADCFVDAIEIARATEHGIATLTLEQQRGLSRLFTGDFLQGL
ncbi:MAG TPA: transcriptional regulator, partial [Burkholderiales bacterium]